MSVVDTHGEIVGVVRSERETLVAFLPSVSRKYQSGETDRIGRISKLGDAMARTALFKAANVMLISAVRFSALKAWAPRVASRRGMNKAKVALARKLAAVMHHMWLDHGVSPGQASHAGRRSLCIAGEARQAIPEFATRTVQIVDICFNVFASATKMIYLQPRSRRCLSLDRPAAITRSRKQQRASHPASSP